MKSVMPGSLEARGHVVEELVQEDHPREVDLGRPDRRHLPVEHGDRLEVAVEDVADARVAPVEHRLALVGPVLLEPRERAVDQRVRHALARPVVVPALVPELLSQRGRRRAAVA